MLGTKSAIYDKKGKAMNTLKITEKENVKEFETQLKRILESNSTDKGIIYIWKTESNIPRVCGESDILYIGKTTQSLRERYIKGKSLNIENEYFENVYKYVIEKYGAISIDVEKVDNTELAQKEYDKLSEYYEKHKELPPLNRSMPPKKEETNK